jgi:hypothetical protein
VYSLGEPEEWRAAQVFSTEEEALAYYKTTMIRPVLERLMAEMTSEKSSERVIRRKLEE